MCNYINKRMMLLNNRFNIINLSIFAYGIKISVPRNILTNIQFIRRFDISINDSLNCNYSIYDKHD